MANGDTNTNLKLIVGVMGSALVTGAAAWFSFGGGVTEARVREMIQTEAPYIEDRQWVLEMTRSNTNQVSAILESLNKLQVSLAETNTRLNSLNDRMNSSEDR